MKIDKRKFNRPAKPGPGRPKKDTVVLYRRVPADKLKECNDAVDVILKASTDDR
jgi:hypothetical protein